MKKGLLIFLGIAAVVGFMSISTYNRLVSLRETVKEKWSQVENVYQRRMDLIPNLVATVKGYAAHEKQTLTAVIEARNKAYQNKIDVSSLSDKKKFAAFAQSQDMLSSALSKLMVVVERYPDLKASQNFLALQSQLEGTENRIAVERRRYNEAVRAYHTAIKTFPANTIAGMFGFKEMAYFKAEPKAAEVPKVQF